MKRLLAVLVPLAGVMALSGCATGVPAGGLYFDAKLPVDAESVQGEATKKGTSTCNSYLLLIATGDCSIQTAKENGNIDEIHHVDWDAENILGIIGTYKVTVYGE